MGDDLLIRHKQAGREGLRKVGNKSIGMVDADIGKHTLGEDKGR